MIERYFDPILDPVRNAVNELRRRIFGANNENIDFLMDSFHKLSPEQRFAVAVGSAVGAAVLGVMILFLYFARVSALETELNASFTALHQLRQLRSEYEIENGKFSRMVDAVGRKTGSVRYKPFFEEKARTIGVEVLGLNDQQVPIGPENPLSTKMQYVRIDMQLPKISLPRLLNFLTEVEKSNNYTSVDNLTIQGRYGTKLFFDAKVAFRGYAVTGASSSMPEPMDTQMAPPEVME